MLFHSPWELFLGTFFIFFKFFDDHFWVVFRRKFFSPKPRLEGAIWYAMQDFTKIRQFYIKTCFMFIKFINKIHSFLFIENQNEKLGYLRVSTIDADSHKK